MNLIVRKNRNSDGSMCLINYIDIWYNPKENIEMWGKLDRHANDIPVTHKIYWKEPTCLH